MLHCDMILASKGAGAVSEQLAADFVRAKPPAVPRSAGKMSRSSIRAVKERAEAPSTCSHEKAGSGGEGCTQSPRILAVTACKGWNIQDAGSQTFHELQLAAKPSVSVLLPTWCTAARSYRVGFQRALRPRRVGQRTRVAGPKMPMGISQTRWGAPPLARDSPLMPSAWDWRCDAEGEAIRSGCRPRSRTPAG